MSKQPVHRRPSDVLDKRGISEFSKSIKNLDPQTKDQFRRKLSSHFPTKLTTVRDQQKAQVILELMDSLEGEGTFFPDFLELFRFRGGTSDRRSGRYRIGILFYSDGSPRGPDGSFRDGR